MVLKIFENFEAWLVSVARTKAKSVGRSTVTCSLSLSLSLSLSPSLSLCCKATKLFALVSKETSLCAIDSKINEYGSRAGST